MTKYPNTTELTKFVYNIEKTGTISTNTFRKYYDHVVKFKSLSALDDKKFEFVASRMLSCMYLRHKDFRAWYSSRNQFTVVLSSIRKAYYEIIGSAFNKVNTNVFQELDVPSEVISIMSEVKSPYYSNILKGLKQL